MQDTDCIRASDIYFVKYCSPVPVPVKITYEFFRVKRRSQHSVRRNCRFQTLIFLLRLHEERKLYTQFSEPKSGTHFVDKCSWACSQNPNSHVYIAS